MIHVKFDNLEPSQLAKEAVEESFEPILKSFPLFAASQVWVTLSTENSTLIVGPDLFRVSVRVGGGMVDGLSTTYVAPSLFDALSGASQILRRELDLSSQNGNPFSITG